MTIPSLTKPDINEDTLRSWLHNRLSEDRYQHSLGAHHKATELAKNFKFSSTDIERAALAGLLHDAAKLMGPKELFEWCDMMNLPITAEERESPQTLHPFVGAELVRLEFGIEDIGTLDAIRYHTTGRAGMSAVEKVVFIADKIEENTRNPLYTQKITKILDYRDAKTLDLATLYVLDSTMTFLIEKRQRIHSRTVAARNDLISQMKAAQPGAANAKNLSPAL